jgi:nickel-dependent lactate racemase
MNQVTTTSFAPAIVDVIGKTKVERQLSVVSQCDGYTKMALANAKGKLGLAVRNGVANGGLMGIAKQASNGNYKPCAEYIAARTGKPFVISSRASFESLADQFEMSIMAAKSAKNGGYVLDKKTGAHKPSATHALALELKAIAIELIANAAAFHAERVSAKSAIEA